MSRTAIVIGVVLVGCATVGLRYAVAWRNGDDIRIPGVGLVRRFPCATYEVPHDYSGTTQAFAAIDRAALAAQSNNTSAVRALVDAVFDRELPHVRCGNSLRRRVADAESQARAGTRSPISERDLAEAANDALTVSAAPAWARISVEELHVMRTALRPFLPRLIGSFDRGSRRSDVMAPIEAMVLVMTLGRAMILQPDELRGGPAAYTARIQDNVLRSNSPQPAGAVLRATFMSESTINLAEGDDFNDPRTPTASSAQRFLDRLGFPP